MSSQPILTVERDQASPEVKAVPNLLPCRVHDNGPVSSVSSFWKPEHAQGSTSVAYFRGRKLQGKTLALPDRFEGAVMERKQPQQQGPGSPDPQLHDERAGETADTAGMHVTARFDSVVVWSHQVAADSASDPYIKSIEEWLHVADQIHSYTEQDEAE